MMLNKSTRVVGSTVSQLISSASQGNKDITNRAARDTANALRDFTAAVRGVAATTQDNQAQYRVLDSAQLVMSKSARLVLEAQRSISNPGDDGNAQGLTTAGKEVSIALNDTIECLP